MVDVEMVGLKDLAELTSLRLGYLTDDFGELSRDEAHDISHELDPYLRAHLNKDLFVFAVRREDTIACCAWLLLVEKPPSPRFPHGRTGVLFNVYTRPAHRRRGLARTTMQALLGKARELNLDVVELHATDDGYPLYQSLGFEDDSSTHRAMRMML